MEGNPFVPVQELNELRRRGFAALEEGIQSSFRRKIKELLPERESGASECKTAPDMSESGAEDKDGLGKGLYSLNVSVEEPEQFETVLE